MIIFFLKKYIYKYIFQFRLRWSFSSFLVKSASLYVEPNINKISIFETKYELMMGWYMLEVKIKLPTPRLNIHVLTEKRLDHSVTPLNFPIFSKRKCKRLIFIKSKSFLQIFLKLQPENFEIQCLNLVRVTEKFALSRMLTKLKALHPNFKINSTLYNKKNLKTIYSISTLFNDYCDLFTENLIISSYTYWLKKFVLFEKFLYESLIINLNKFLKKPMISFIVPVFNPNIFWLKQTIVSVRNQIYQNWELCISDDASTDPAIRTMLEQYASEDNRIKLVFREQNGHISAASNSALALAQGEWIALLDHDDVLAEHALFWVVDAINRNPSCRMMYSDEDKIDEMGVRSDPYFKCDWNQDLFYSQNMFSHLGVYHTDLVREVGGFRVGFEGSQDYDLALRCIERITANQIHHIPRVLYHWRMHADSTAHSSDAKPYAMVAGARALNEHLERQGVNARAESLGYGYRVRYALPKNLPLVSLIIPTRNGLKLLRRCVDSILEKTSYAHYEILIVDNGSDDAATLRYLKRLSDHSCIRVIRDDRPFNYSALNNAAVKLARGEIIGLINNDIEVINSDWLSEMVSHAVRPEVGAVGARLWYPDDTLQHAGVVLGVHGIAGHAHRFLPRDHVGYCGRASLIQSFSAVTAACLLVRKSIYQALDGLNETELAVACNDVDFCLRVREAGYRNIWTPYAELYHHESASRGFDDTPEKLARSAKEIAYMKQRWGDALLHDPAYSPNLSLDNEDFTLAWPPRIEALI